jgi:hypothetical protein
MNKYIFRSVKDKKEAVIYTEIGKTPKGLIVFSLESRPGKEDVTCLEPAMVAQEMIEYHEPKKGTVWVNIYSAWGYTHESRALADQLASTHRLACVEVPWVEGQGLEKKKCFKCNGTGWLEDKIGDGGRSCRCDCC